MKKWLGFALLLLAAVSAQAQTSLAGNVVTPTGGAINGNLYISLEKTGLLDTCVTPAQVVPVATVIIPVVNGSLTGSNIFVPTDCLSSFQPYKVILKDKSQKVLFTVHWYVMQPAGGVTYPSTGTVWVATAGLGASIFFNNIVYQIRFPSGYVTASSSGSIGGGATQQVAITWPTPFTNTNYQAVCTVLDTTAPASPQVVTGTDASATPITNVTKTGLSLAITNLAGGSRNYTATCRAE